MKSTPHQEHTAYIHIYAFICQLSHTFLLGQFFTDLSISWISLENYYRNKIDVQLLFSFFLFFSVIYLALWDLGQRSNAGLTLHIFKTCLRGKHQQTQSGSSHFIPDQDEPGTEDEQTPDIVLHNHFRSRSCIGTSMQFHIQCAAPAHQLPPQESAQFALCVRCPWSFCFPPPLPHSLKMETSQRHQTSASSAGLGILSCTRWTRTYLVNVLLQLPGDGCKRPDQTAISVQHNKGGQETT